MSETRDQRPETRDHLVSFIVPSYNYGHYIGRCLDSLINQTHQNIEIIVIDDCSTDNTEEIVKSYQQKDNRIKYVKNETNLKILKNRIIGTRMATGEYISVVSADDAVTENYVEVLLKTAIDNDADIVCCRIVESKETWDIQHSAVEFSYEDEDIINSLIDRHTERLYPKNYGLRRFFSRELLLKTFDMLEKDHPNIYMARAEDLLFHIYAHFVAKKLVHIPDRLYYYYKNETSVSRGSSEKHLLDSINSYDIIYHSNALNLLSKENKNLIQKEMVKRFYATGKQLKKRGKLVLFIKKAPIDMILKAIVIKLKKKLNLK